MAAHFAAWLRAGPTKETNFAIVKTANRSSSLISANEILEPVRMPPRFADQAKHANRRQPFLLWEISEDERFKTLTPAVKLCPVKTSATTNAQAAAPPNFSNSPLLIPIARSFYMNE